MIEKKDLDFVTEPGAFIEVRGIVSGSRKIQAEDMNSFGNGQSFSFSSIIQK